LRPADHLLRCATREREQQDASWIRAVDHELRDAMRERRRLASARARDDEERSVSFMQNGGLLLAVKGRGRWHLSI
jgi:hypothetical protein